MEQFRNIGLIGRIGSVQVVETLKRLKNFLLNEGYQVILEGTEATVLPGHGLQVSTRKLMGEICDLVIVVGGDGSLLGAARALAKCNVPVLWVNRGQLGFLTDISPLELEEKVGEVLAGEYIEESRFLLDMYLKRDGEPSGYGCGLHDSVLHPGNAAPLSGCGLQIAAQRV